MYRFPAPPNSRSPIKRRGLIDNAVADGLLALDWPDEQQTPLRRFASEEQIRHSMGFRTQARVDRLRPPEGKVDAYVCDDGCPGLSFGCRGTPGGGWSGIR